MRILLFQLIGVGGHCAQFVHLKACAFLRSSQLPEENWSWIVKPDL
jgi:hypothetical protein